MMAARQTNTLLLPRLLQGLMDVTNVPSIEVTHIALDSREVQPDGVFLACRGLTSHGLDYLHQALRLGAKVVLWEPVDNSPQPVFPSTVTAIAVPDLAKKVGQIAARFYGEPANSLRVTGITGTNGKTSCAHLLAQALTRDNAVCGVLGTLGQGIYHLDSPLQPGTHTTPNPVAVQSLLADFVTQDASFAAMEVSSHALDQGRVSGLRFHTAVFTNLTHDHLDYHGDLLHYASAKQKLFLSDGLRHAVINADDDTGRAMLKTLPETVSAIAYGLNNEADNAFELPANVRGLFATCRLHSDGLTLHIKSPFGDGELQARLLGRFNAYNLLAVLGSLLTLDVPFQKALGLLSQSRTVPGRMECFGGNHQPLVVVDYAHTPDALRQVLIAARAHCTGKLYCVFGCGGDRDTAKRPVMGALAATLADEVILTDDNPRTEDPMQIINNILSGIDNKNNVHVEQQRATAIEQTINRAQAGDVVLIAGKGHEDYQIYGNEQRPYSDRTTVQQHLGGAA
ncbi:MAG TPA: UDP-N-acetylmuramoyl-L-alanyl-D-glutamate--2,6-diaminopimelate ligase [Gammaproteobacteria bacterium]|nr:UDP-N-acetylmuramoyl-L-alanyl-D-glutamate--2,6-diaminopimelate ligase [Gammaproteobacteria bacterium]